MQANQYAFFSTMNHYTQRHLDAALMVKEMGHGGSLNANEALTVFEKMSRPMRVLDFMKDMYQRTTIPCESDFRQSNVRTGMATDMAFYALGRSREINGYTTSVLWYFPKPHEMNKGTPIVAGDVYTYDDLEALAKHLEGNKRDLSGKLLPILLDVRECFHSNLRSVIPNVEIFEFSEADHEKAGRHGMKKAWVVLWPATMLRYEIDTKTCRPYHIPSKDVISREDLLAVAQTQLNTKYRSNSQRINLCSKIKVGPREEIKVEDFVKPVVFNKALQLREDWKRFEFHCFDLLRQGVDENAYLVPLSSNLTGIDRSDSGKMDALYLSPVRAAYRCAMTVDFTQEPNYMTVKAAQMDNMLDATTISLVTDSRFNRNDLLNRGFSEDDLHHELMRHDRTFQQHVHHTYFRLRHLRDGEIDIRCDALVGGLVILNNVNEPRIERSGEIRKSRCGQFSVYNHVISVGAGYIGNYIRKSAAEFQDGKTSEFRPDFMHHLLEWVRLANESEIRKTA